MSELVEWAFRALGPPGPEHRREMALIAKAIRESRDEEALALFWLDGAGEPLGVDHGEVLGRVTEVARRADRESEAFYLWTFVCGFDSPYVQRCLRTALSV